MNYTMCIGWLPYLLGPAFSTPAFWCRIFQSCIFSRDRMLWFACKLAHNCQFNLAHSLVYISLHTVKAYFHFGCALRCVALRNATRSRNGNKPLVYTYNRYKNDRLFYLFSLRCFLSSFVDYSFFINNVSQIQKIFNWTLGYIYKPRFSTGYWQ